jgi:hypothetical protein
LKKIGNALGSFDNRDVRPDRYRLNLSLEHEPQRPVLASGIGIERGRAVCDLDEIMQILPGSSDNARAYKCVTPDLQDDIRVRAGFGAKITAAKRERRHRVPVRMS